MSECSADFAVEFFMNGGVMKDVKNGTGDRGGSGIGAFAEITSELARNWLYTNFQCGLR